jgi:hypothetical protein
MECALSTTSEWGLKKWREMKFFNRDVCAEKADSAGRKPTVSCLALNLKV